MWLSIIIYVLRCRYRDMGAQVEARLRSFTSRREFVEKTSYDDVSCSSACLANRVQHSLLELRGLVHCVMPPDCVYAPYFVAPDTRDQSCECSCSSLQVLLDTLKVRPDKYSDMSLQMYLDVTDLCGHGSDWRPPAEAPPGIRVEGSCWDDVASDLRSGVQVGN